MKIALCMHGVTGGCGGGQGKGEPVDIAFCKYTMDKRIFNKNDPIDVFVHSWSVERKDEILELYKPISYLIEPQIVFSDDIRTHLSRSRWYSSNESLRLKAAYERQRRQEMRYDCVMTCRFDVVFKKNLRFNEHDMQYFWAALAPNRTAPGEGKKVGLFLEDFWFFSNSENMDYLATILEDQPSRNNHKAVYAHIMKKCEIRYTMQPPRDFDLYRWYTRLDDKYPRKWYKGAPVPNDGR